MWDGTILNQIMFATATALFIDIAVSTHNCGDSNNSKLKVALIFATVLCFLLRIKKSNPVWFLRNKEDTL